MRDTAPICGQIHRLVVTFWQGWLVDIVIRSPDMSGYGVYDKVNDSWSTTMMTLPCLTKNPTSIIASFSFILQYKYIQFTAFDSFNTQKKMSPRICPIIFFMDQVVHLTLYPKLNVKENTRKLSVRVSEQVEHSERFQSWRCLAVNDTTSNSLI